MTSSEYERTWQKLPLSFTERHICSVSREPRTKKDSNEPFSVKGEQETMVTSPDAQPWSVRLPARGGAQISPSDGSGILDDAQFFRGRFHV